LDIVTGEINGKSVLPPGSRCHHLIEVLLRDFYRPLKMGEIFVELFPGEYFDIFSSPNRVHQLLFRTRDWIAQQNLPLEINELAGGYSLKTTAPFAFKIPLNRRPVEGYHQLLEKISSLFGADDVFQSKSVREVLGISRQTFSRFATWAVENGKLEKIGSHNKASYRFKISRIAA
jgi:hypothetical protein